MSSDTRKQTAFRLDRGLLAEVDEACGVRGLNRTQAVEEALRGWLGSPAGSASVSADAVDRGVQARSVAVPRTERIEIAAQAAPVRPAAAWLGNQHLPTCRCGVCKPS